MLIVHNNLAFLQLSCKGLKLFQNKSLKFKICFGIKEGNLQKATGNLTLSRDPVLSMPGLLTLGTMDTRVREFSAVSHPVHCNVFCSIPGPTRCWAHHQCLQIWPGIPGGAKSPSENGWTVLSPGGEPSPQPAWPCAQPAYSEGMCRPVAGLQPGPCLPRVSLGRRHPGHGSAAVAAAHVSASQSRKCLAS